MHACSPMEEAATWMQQRLEVRKQLTAAVTPPFSDSAAAATTSPELPFPCSAALVDLDSKGVSDDGVMESFDTLAGVGSAVVFKMLFLYSARHIMSLPLSEYIGQGKRSVMRTSALQKPFKMAQLLQSLLQLINEDLSSSSLQEGGSEGTLTRRSGSALLALPQPPTSNGSTAPNKQTGGGQLPSSRSSSSLSSGSGARNKIPPMADQFPLRILLAEDNLINQKMMVMLLRKLGYEILVAANGQEVLQRLESEARRGKEFEIECILMDASMDVMDGQSARQKWQQRTQRRRR